MVLPLLAGLGVLVLMALVVSLAICVAAARADQVMRSGVLEGEPAPAQPERPPRRTRPMLRS